MPFPNARRNHGPAWSVLFLPLIATGVAPAVVGAAESIPRTCDEMSFKAIAQMMDAAGNFQTRLALLGKSLVQERSMKHSADNESGATAGDMEEVNVSTLRNALAEVWGYLLASENLAAVRDLTVDERDRLTLDRQLNLVSRQILEPLSFGLESAENVSAMTKHPAIAAEVSKIHDFMDETRSQFAACAGQAGH